jgi:hypothetical protein
MSESDTSFARGGGADADPSGNTEAFRAFARRTVNDAPPARRRSTAVLAGAIAVVVVAITIVVVLVAT